MKHLTLILIFMATVASGQVSGVVKDSLTGKVVPYINLLFENAEAGITTDRAGRFIIPEKFEDKPIVVYAPGYEIKKAKASSKEILLSSIKKESKNYSPKKSQTVTVGTYKEQDIKSFLNPNNTPVIYARHITHNGNPNETLYIKNIKASIVNTVANAKARIRFFEVNKDGSPGKEILNNDIIVSISEGANHIEANIEKERLIFPKDGVFAGIEWLFIKENHYIETAMKGINGKEHPGYETYFPIIGAYPSDETGIWQFSGTSIKPSRQPKDKKDRFSNKYTQMALSLTLTN